MQEKIVHFYAMRGKVLRQKEVNIDSVLAIAKDLSLKDVQVQTKIQFELQQLKKITRKEECAV